MQSLDDPQDEAPPNPRHSMDPLVSAMPLTRPGVLQPYAAPFKGSIHRPDFRTVQPLREIVPDTPPMLDTHAEMQQAQARRERQAQADRERLASMPSKEEQQAREIAALKADLADLRTRFARLEAQTRPRGRSRTSDGPEAA